MATFEEILDVGVATSDVVRETVRSSLTAFVSGAFCFGGFAPGPPSGSLLMGGRKESPAPVRV